MRNPPGSPLTRGAKYVAPCLAAALCCSGQLQAALVNAGFETGDLSSWTVIGSVSVSTGHDYGSYHKKNDKGELVFIEPIVSPNPGAYLARLNATSQVTSEAIAAAMGIDRSVLEASNHGVKASNGSMISQTISASAGKKLTFNWNFAERDYGDWNDWSFFGVGFNGGAANLSFLASVATVSPNDMMFSENTAVSGWKSFDYEIQQDGDYTFYFGVINAMDNGFGSELWVDTPEASISPIPEPGSVLGLGMLLGSGLFVRSRRRKVQPAAV